MVDRANAYAAWHAAELALASACLGAVEAPDGSEEEAMWFEKYDALETAAIEARHAWVRAMTQFPISQQEA